MIGQTISHYKIFEKLGEGGMGVVYKAQDTTLDRFVALKFLPQHLAASDQDKARFVQEAKAAAALNHPNICSVIAIEECDGQMFIVMEFVDGQTLREKLTANPPHLKSAIEIGIQIADGLAAAHEKGIVHRDIKPENIMVRKDGICQIMDFGLAKLRASGSKITRLTKEGSTLGTAGYMSPEQVQGQDTDHRSDIFSLGVLLYEMFTGGLPFKGVHETALLYEIVNVDPAPMSAIKQEIDPELDRIVLECLQKEPSERHQSVAEVSKDLKRFKRESSRQHMSRVTSARQVFNPSVTDRAAVMDRPSRRSVWWPVASAVLAFLLLAAGWSLWKKSTVAAPTLRLSISMPKDQVIESENFYAIALSPDGSRVVYRASRRLYQRRLDSFESEPIAGTEDGSSPFFSPDGRWLGFFAGGRLKKVALSGGSPVTLTSDVTDNRGGVWLSNGTIVFAPRGNNALFRVREDGGDVKQLTTLDSARNERTHRWPKTLPDGETVIFTVGSMDSPDYYEDAEIVAVNVRTGERTNIMTGASSATYADAGYLVYSHTGDLFAVPFDPASVKVTGPAFPVGAKISGDQTTGAMNYAVSRNGVLAYIPGQIAGNENRQLAIVDTNGNASVLPLPPRFYLEPRISPDGTKIAVVVGTEKDFDVWIHDVKLKTMNRFTFGGANRSPVWSPDGQRIAYSDNRANALAVIVRRADGTGATETIPMGRRSYVNDWSSDGTTLIVSAPTIESGWNLYIVPLAGDRVPRVWNETPFDEFQGSLSPDGKWLSHIYRERGGLGQIVVRPFPSGDARWQISGLASESHWSRDGKMIYSLTQEGLVAVPVVAGQSFSVGQSHVVLKGYQRLAVESAMTFDLAFDRRHIVLTQSTGESSAASQINIVTNWFDEIQKLVSTTR
jgi:serine/threonine protein kinase